MAQHITVTEYSHTWPQLFETEARLIRQILGGNCLAVHHIGSTSVPGLAAKPIIDIMPVVKDIGAVDNLAAEFQRNDYEYLGEFGIADRRYLRKGRDERTHQIHVFEQSNTWAIQRHLALRDYLRGHPETAWEYGELKKELAERYPYDIDGYCDGKDEYVKDLEQKAMQWKGETE